jgi:hypothetical protein
LVATGKPLPISPYGDGQYRSAKLENERKRKGGRRSIHLRRRRRRGKGVKSMLRKSSPGETSAEAGVHIN